MADSITNQRHEYEERKEAVEKNIKELETQIQQQGDRINHLQSSGFQLLNFYFFFQGVIFTAIANGSSALSTSTRWLPFCLSLLAAVLNLASLYVIGGKYNRIITEQDRSWTELHALREDLVKVMREFQSSGRLDAAASTPDQMHNLVDSFSSRTRKLSFVLCMVVCLGVVVIMGVACWKIKREETIRHSSNAVDKCFRVCNANCVGVCNGY